MPLPPPSSTHFLIYPLSVCHAQHIHPFMVTTCHPPKPILHQSSIHLSFIFHITLTHLSRYSCLSIHLPIIHLAIHPPILPSVHLLSAYHPTTQPFTCPPSIHSSVKPLFATQPSIHHWLTPLIYPSCLGFQDGLYRQLCQDGALGSTEGS